MKLFKLSENKEKLEIHALNYFIKCDIVSKSSKRILYKIFCQQIINLLKFTQEKGISNNSILFKPKILKISNE